MVDRGLWGKGRESKRRRGIKVREGRERRIREKKVLIVFPISVWKSWVVENT